MLPDLDSNAVLGRFDDLFAYLFDFKLITAMFIICTCSRSVNMYK